MVIADSSSSADEYRKKVIAETRGEMSISNALHALHVCMLQDLKKSQCINKLDPSGQLEKKNFFC